MRLLHKTFAFALASGLAAILIYIIGVTNSSKPTSISFLFYLNN